MTGRKEPRDFAYDVGFVFQALLSRKERKTLRRHQCGVEGWRKNDRDTHFVGSTKLDEKKKKERKYTFS